MILSEEYKGRLRKLAGIEDLNELDNATKYDLFDKSKSRTNFNLDKMKMAIENGEEIGLGYQSKNSKYTMPIMKYRIIWPVAIGYNKKGELILRGVHISGQSERAARETGIRSAEAENEWRLFKISNIKSMWNTGRYFNTQIPFYNPADKSMSSVITNYDPAVAAAYQDTLIQKQEEQPVEPEAPETNKPQAPSANKKEAPKPERAPAAAKKEAPKPEKKAATQPKSQSNTATEEPEETTV